MGKLNWKTLIPLGFIFLLFAVTRFYDLQHRTVFNWDQEQFSNQIIKLVQDHKPSLLGPRVNNDNGFFLAPYFTYLLVPFYLLTRLHPVGMLIFQVIINTVFFALAYKVVAKLYSTTHALFFLLLWALSFMLQDLETITWWPILIPPGILLVWFLQWKLYKHPEKTRLWIAAGVVSGFFINMHFQFIFILLQLGLFTLLLNIQNKKIFIKNMAIALGSFLFMFTPLLIFDLRNNFLNLHLFTNYFLNTDTIYNVRYYDWTYILAHLFLPYIFVHTKTAGLIALIGLLGATLYLYRRNSGFKSLFYLTNAFMIVVTFVVFNVFSVRPSEYYFLFLLPIFLVSLVDLFMTHRLVIPLVALCFVYAVVNAPMLRINLESNFDSLRIKDDLVKYIQQQVGNKKFFISFDGPTSSDNGFRYLIKVRKLNSSPDGRNPQIQVKSPPPDQKLKFGWYGVIIPEELKR